MTEPAFQRVEELFHRAAEAPAERRAAFLDAACGGDAALRAAVQELLDHDTAEDDDFLASPVARPTGGSDAPTLPAPPGAPVPTPAVAGYEFLGEIGRGGMGVVYKARQLSLGRLVALKMLLPPAPGDPTPLARFRTEAEVLARLRHPNIVPIYDFGEHETRPYFTMEYVPGPNLARFLDRRPQDAAASARLVETLARAVHAAHEAGVVHRDIKPANVLLAPPVAGRASLAACEPRLTDFGLARDAASPQDLTRTGVAVGTPCYMAPEQARGDKDAGPGTDIYALGAILYEMLSGRPPFDAETTAETIRQVVYDDPVIPSRLRPGLPHDLITICMKCLEKSPRRRYATALDLAEDLRRFGAGEPIRARPVRWAERAYRWGRRRPLAALLLALLAALTTAFVASVLVYDHLLRQSLAREAALNEELRRRVVRLDVAIGLGRQESGDAFTALLYYTDALRLDESLPEGEGDDRARIAAVLSRCPRLLLLLTLDGPADRASVSADGRSVVVMGRDGAVRLCDLNTGEIRLLEGEEAFRTAPPARGPVAAVSPDGRLAVGADAAGGVSVREAATGRPVAPPMRQGGPATAAAFSPDGKRAVVVGAAGVVCVWDLTGGGETAAQDVVGRTPDELEALAEVLAGARLDGRQEPAPLGATALRAAWDRAPRGR